MAVAGEGAGEAGEDEISPLDDMIVG